ncbi:MAG: hypothetical protein HS117_15140 [Verrucomicrobiaceae bacterium]|jgi:uncharacterized paraquat-inducible protein A|nr:hypothetical protein [Verrucomicrobiaceae bacterium]
MIPIHLSDLIMLFMAVGVTVVCLLWFWTFVRERRRETHRRRIAIQCRICATAYARDPKSKSSVTICPVCHTPNERNRLRPI